MALPVKEMASFPSDTTLVAGSAAGSNAQSGLKRTSSLAARRCPLLACKAQKGYDWNAIKVAPHRFGNAKLRGIFPRKAWHIASGRGEEGAMTPLKKMSEKEKQLYAIFKKAVHGEREAQAMYEKAMELSSDPMLTAVLQGFLEDERRHEKGVIARYHQFRKDYQIEDEE